MLRTIVQTLARQRKTTDPLRAELPGAGRRRALSLLVDEGRPSNRANVVAHRGNLRGREVVGRRDRGPGGDHIGAVGHLGRTGRAERLGRRNPSVIRGKRWWNGLGFVQHGEMLPQRAEEGNRENHSPRSRPVGRSLTSRPSRGLVRSHPDDEPSARGAAVSRARGRGRRRLARHPAPPHDARRLHGDHGGRRRGGAGSAPPGTGSHPPRRDAPRDERARLPQARSARATR